AEAAAVAGLQVEDDRDQSGQRIDLGAERDAVFRTGGDAAPAPLAVLGEEERLGALALRDGLGRHEVPSWRRVCRGGEPECATPAGWEGQPRGVGDRSAGGGQASTERTESRILP